MSKYLLAIDQGTTNSRAILFDRQLKPIASHEITLAQYFPQPGWVEQDAVEMFENSVECARIAMTKIKCSAKDIISIGITNQRETSIIWDINTGKPIYNAIVWQDQRTSEMCQQLKVKMDNYLLHDKTGLRLDPYFSATKIAWILNHVDGSRERAQNGELLFGTVESYLLWRLTNGESHFSDVSNAARTLLFNIQTQSWDTELLKFFDIPTQLLPKVVDNIGQFGRSATEFFGESIPINALAGDQQAAAIGQGCFQAGQSKATFGTGCFVLFHTGKKIIHSNYNLLSTIAYRINGEIAYCLEGSIFSAGVAIKWLRDTLNLIQTAAETETLAQSLSTNEGVYLVPAFTGLGAPHWNSEVQAATFGLTRNSNRSHFARAALESVAYQLKDLLNVMHLDTNIRLQELHVDGGMVANDWLMQFVADILQIPIMKPACIETTALGVAFLAGFQQNVFTSLEEINDLNAINKQFNPTMPSSEAAEYYRGWQTALARLI